MSLFILIELQLIFGKKFTTFHLFGPLHLSDLLIFILGIASLVFIIRKGIRIPVSWPLIALITVSFGYLIYSVLYEIGPLNYIIRHYTLFIYLGLSFFIFHSFINDEKLKVNFKFFWLIGIMALIGQLLMHAYNFFIVENYYTELFSRFNYLSEMTIVGLVVITAWVLCFFKNPMTKYISAFGILFISTTLGQASAFLASLVPIIFHFMFLLKIRPLIFFILIFTSVFLLYLLLPQFSDVNALWRVLYWREILKDGIINYYGILGHGFGGPFITESINQAFLTELSSVHFDVNPEEKFLTPMHNSFITIMFHIGIIPGLLIFFPLKNMLIWLFRKKEERDHNKEFLVLSLIGLMVWSSFNVVLELPHSSAFFWLVYFSVLYKFKAYKRFTVIKLGFFNAKQN